MKAHKRLRLLLVCALSVGMLTASTPAYAIDTGKMADALVNQDPAAFLAALGLDIIPQQSGSESSPEG